MPDPNPKTYQRIPVTIQEETIHLYHHPQTPQVVVAFEVTGCDALMSKERVKACMDGLQTALKGMPGPGP